MAELGFHRAADLPDLLLGMKSNLLVAEVPWLRRGHKTLISGAPKLGKTTFITSLVIAAMAVAPVLIFTEDTPATWVERGAAEWTNVDFIYRFDVMGMDWAEKCQQITNLVNFRGHALVVMDTFYELSQVKDENNAAEVAAALRLTNPICDECGASLALAAHTRKGGGSHGEGVRGTGALIGGVDVFVELARARSPRQRIITAEGRFDVPPRLTMELSPEGRYFDVEAPVFSCLSGLPADAPGLTWQEVLERWPSTVRKPERTKILEDLKKAHQAGRLIRDGGGKGPGDPYRFRLNHPERPSLPPPLGGGEGGRLGPNAAQTIINRVFRPLEPSANGRKLTLLDAPPWTVGDRLAGLLDHTLSSLGVET